MSQDLSTEQVEIIQEFIQECSELIENLEPSIIDLGNNAKEGFIEIDEGTAPVLNEIFRLFHSIKGSAGFLNFDLIATTSHAAENLLDQIRNGSIKMREDHVDLLCRSCDFTREALEYVAEHLNDKGLGEQANELSTSLKAALDREDDSVPQTVEDDTEPVPATVAEEPEQGDGDAGENKFEFAITPDMVERFLQEADEGLQVVEDGLLKLSKAPGDTEIIAEIYRHMHTFKGNCGFLGYVDLEKFSHRLETVLDAVKAGEIRAESSVAESLLVPVDVLKNTVADISNDGKGQIDGLDLYLQMLDEYLPKDGAPSQKSAPMVGAPRIGDILIEKGEITEEILDEALDKQNKPIGEILVDMGAASTGQIDGALETQAKMKREAAKEQVKDLPEIKSKPPAIIKRQDIRVDLEKLDVLIDLIGEMVIAENMVVNSPDLAGLDLENFSKSAQHMAKLVKELQEVAVTIRLIPVAGLFRRMTRLVHDLSRKANKKVDFHLEGMETELDKTVIETITDPLVHLIRNSLDHGLETPEERSKTGKSNAGNLTLRASHEEGEVWILLDDDGRGLNREKIIKKAISRGLIDGDGSNVSDKEISGLIFQAGFSTAEKITDVSGRGVGMDVVKQNLTKIDGKIEVDSQPGKGTKILLRIPLTMAIIEGMLIRVGESRYILPILNIRESFQPDAHAITVSPDGQELVRVRDNLYPIIRLHKAHKIVSDTEELHEGILILLEGQDREICLFVDEILGQQQTVIKGLSEYIGKLGDVGGVSGCTILGNGEVCLILDVGSLLEMAGRATEG